MPTLSVVKVDFIKVSKWIGIVLAILIAIFLLIKGLFFIKELIWPTPPPPPTVTFGKLPKPYFPEGIKKNFKYTIDTLSGELPKLPDRTNVYEMGKSEPDILAVQRMTEKAVSLGFNPETEQLSETVYRWRSTGEKPTRVLVVNVLLAEFNLSSDFLSNKDLLSETGALDEAEAINTAKGFLNTLSLFPSDLDELKTKTKLLKLENGLLIEVEKPKDAKIINIYFFQKDINELPIVYPIGGGSSIQLTVAGGRFNNEVIDGRYFYQNITEESGTYPIISAETAFEQLKKGNVFIASHEGQDLNIVIKKVYLAYYASGRSQDFLTPVVVFEGKNNFVAYVPAVTPEWIGN